MSKKLQKNKSDQHPVSVATMQKVEFSGPLPHPHYLEQYNRVLPGLADRITKMAEEQSKHRQIMERRLLWFDGFKSVFGLIFALIIVLTGLGIGAYLIMHNKSIEALFAGLIPLGTVVAAFVYQQRKRD
jgi:uncharacterized membrane protein